MQQLWSVSENASLCVVVYKFGAQMVSLRRHFLSIFAIVIVYRGGDRPLSMLGPSC